ncbi:MAG: class I SAM-dependent methyltransferase [Caldilineaceae bacterium]|nr:class I SAM-dependent methyltransferase [Caldilineaceae bacterium]
MTTEQIAFTRYLSAKRTVDDRALNHTVWQALKEQLATEPPDAPLAVLEIGCGIGTMIERVVEWDLFGPRAQQVRYHAIDSEAGNIANGQQRLAASTPPFAMKMEVMDLFAFLHKAEEVAGEEQSAGNRLDLMIAHAFLDLVDLPSTLPRLVARLKPGGLLYATINFDGITALEPAVDAALDDHIERLYHATMDQRVINGQPSGDSRAGRHLLSHLRDTGMQLLAAGSSDWVVHAVDGRYPADEAFFLHFILNTMEGALRGHPALDADTLTRWAATRRAQIDRGELIYIAHQLDVLAQRPAEGPAS